MTSNYTKIKNRILIALLILGLVFTSLFFFTSCAKSSSSSKDPDYSYSQKDDKLISNPNFNYGAMELEYTSFPIKSPTGWSRSKDSNASSSSSRSGVVDLSAKGWEKLMSNMYTDAYYLDYIRNSNDGFTKDDVKQILKDQGNSSPTSTDVKNYILEHYMNAQLNPGVHDGATDNKVYMLNNYTSNLGFGASQKITSSKSITVKKGQLVKISLYLKTENLSAYLSEYGASIRLTNTFNGKAQAEYVIKNIVADDAWKNIVIYVQGDAEFDSTVTLALGLGYGVLSQTEGTVYFDDITVEENAKVPPTTADVVESNMNFGSEDAVVVDHKKQSTDTFLYDMTLDQSGYKTPLSITSNNTSAFYTKSNSGISSENKFPTTNGSIDTANNQIKASVTNASYTVRIDDDSFIVHPEGYTFVSFNVINRLSKLSNTSITIDLFEETSDPENPYKNAAIATVNDVHKADDSTGTKVGLLVKNNFNSTNTDTATRNRSFFIEIVIGPTNIKNADKVYDYATGDVFINNLSVSSGNSYLYNDEYKDGAITLSKDDDQNYKYLAFNEELATATVNLYAGRTSDYSETEDTTQTNYYFKTSVNDIDNISSRPTITSEYKGVGPNNIRVSNNENIKRDPAINERIEGVNGSYAGVVNSKNDYSSLNFSASAIKNGTDDDQALMIYNKETTEGNYGYIGQTKTISANSRAKISVTLKVDDTATAYVYLVALNSKIGLRDVMSFVDFNENSDGIFDIDKDEQNEVKGSDYKFCIKVTKEQMAKAVNGWLTVDFFVATGNLAKSFRVELWNGDRFGTTPSVGQVFFKSVEFSLNSGFNAVSSFENTFIDSNNNPLFDLGENAVENAVSSHIYKQELTPLEKAFNKDYPNDQKKYSAKYIWVETDTMIYALYDSIEVADYDPYDDIIKEDTKTSTGCTAKTDPSTFWLQFSSILLIVALLLSIIALFVKNIRRRRKANKSDAKSHYTVKSRIKSAKKPAKDKKIKQTDIDDVVANEEIEEEIVDTQAIDSVEEKDGSSNESSLDEYVYGEVQNFGEEENVSENTSNEEN